MRKKYICFTLLSFLLATVMLTACGNLDNWDYDIASNGAGSDSDSDGDGSGSGVEGVNIFGEYELSATAISDLSSLILPDTMQTFALNSASLTETEDTIAGGEDGYEDFPGNFDYDDETGSKNDSIRQLVVTYSGGGVQCRFYNKKGNLKNTFTTSTTIVDNDDDSDTIVTVGISGQHVTVKASRKFIYTLTGTGGTGSSFKLYNDKKFMVRLSDVTLNNDQGPAINLQKSWHLDSESDKLKGKRGFIVIEGNNTLSQSGETVLDDESEDAKGVIFNEGKLYTSGNGTLNVTSAYNNGIASDDYLYAHAGPVINISTSNGYYGVKTNDGIIIGGGALNIAAAGDGARGMDTDDRISLKGGRTIITNSGDYTTAEGELKYAYGMKSTAILVYDGELSVGQYGNGSIGMRADSLYVQNGGTVRVQVRPTNITSSEGTQTIYANNGLLLGDSDSTVGEAYLNGGVMAIYATGGTYSTALRAYNNLTVTGTVAALYGSYLPYYVRMSTWVKGGYLTIYNATTGAYEQVSVTE